MELLTLLPDFPGDLDLLGVVFFPDFLTADIFSFSLV